MRTVQVSVFVPSKLQSPVTVEASSSDSIAKVLVQTAKASKIPVPPPEWIPVAAGLAHPDRTELIGNIASPRTTNLCVVPPIESFLSSIGEVYGIIAQVVDLRFCEGPSSSQNKDSAKQFADVLNVFCEKLFEAGHIGSFGWEYGNEAKTSLQNAINTIRNTKVSSNCPHISWFDEYGCASFACVTAAAKICLSLICLDGWTFKIHAGPEKRFHSSQPRCGQPIILFVGNIPEENYNMFNSKFKELLGKAQQRKGSERSAGDGSQGHQKTPAMIQAIMIDAINTTSSSKKRKVDPCLPRGAFTDAGVHTGGLRRNTSWPLFVSVLDFLLGMKGLSGLCHRVVAQLYLCLAESAASLSRRQIRHCASASALEPLSTFNDMVNTIMQTMEEAIDTSKLFIDAEEWKSEMIIFEARCIRVRHELEAFVSLRSEIVANECILKTVAADNIKSRPICLSIPPKVDENTEVLTRSDIMQFVHQNIGLVPSPPEVDASIDQLKNWMDYARGYNNFSMPVFALMYCTNVERVLFRHMHEISTRGNSFEVSVVCEIADSYRDTISNILSSKELKSLSRAEIKSKELLVVWVCTCLCFQKTGLQEKKLLNYSLPLEPDALRHLVLFEREAVETSLAVFKFIYDLREKKEVLFSKTSQSGLMTLAHDIVLHDEALRKKYEEESNSALKRENARWEVICSKKKKLQMLDLKISNLNEELSGASLEVSELDERIQAFQTGIELTAGSNALSNARKKLKGIESEIKQTKNQIRQVESPPASILQPLPECTKKSYPVVFFLFIPENFRYLLRIIFTAQQLLIPSKPQVQCYTTSSSKICDNLKDIFSCDGPNTQWETYYASQSSSRMYSPSPKEFVLGSRNKPPMGGAGGPRNVRFYMSKREGVWYPDDLRPELYWYGGHRPADRLFGGSAFNVFRQIPSRVTSSIFTDFLFDTPDLQWSLQLQETEPYLVRENEPEATLSRAPNWLVRKDQYLAFTTLRAHPLTQFRKLVAALSQQTFDTRHTDVQTMIRNSLYQLGKIGMHAEPALEWWDDRKMHNGWKHLCSVLACHVNEIRHKPRDHSRIVILIEVANYAAQWVQEARELARQLSTIAERWADSLKKEERLAPVEQLPAIRARRKLFYMYALNGHSTGEMTYQDLLQMIKCQVTVEYLSVFQENTELDNDIAMVEPFVRRTTAARITELLEGAQRRGSILTIALKSVLEFTPNTLSWTFEECQGRQTTCLSAVRDDHVFSVNLLTGTMLFDGMPPQRLPLSITGLELYQRTFGQQNFEVIRKSTGAYQTAFRILGKFYKFYQRKHSQLVTVEESTDGNFPESLELLDGTQNGVGKWGNELPLILRHSHSHWINRNSGTVVLRPLGFRDRRLQFILSKKTRAHEREANSQEAYFTCVKVPLHLQAKKGLEQEFKFESSGTIVRVEDFGGSNALTVLQRIERDTRFIHIFRLPYGDYCFELPRFSLVFEYSLQGKLTCQSFNNQPVAEEQQFCNGLHGFTQYLSIQQENQKTVLIPSGKVEKSSTEISIRLSKNHKQNFHVFEVHTRFGILKAKAGEKCIEGRLQLASLYAACGTLLPDSKLRNTGDEHAIDLMRQCWINKPYNEQELLHFDSLRVTNVLCPTLPLLCYQLQLSAQELYFLYENVHDKSPILDEKAASEYAINEPRTFNHRRKLNANEANLVLGDALEKHPSIHETLPRFIDWEDQVAPTTEDMKAELSKMLENTSNSRSGTGIFPLSEKLGQKHTTTISDETMTELKKSWDSYKAIGTLRMADDFLENWNTQLQNLMSSSCINRKQIQDECISRLNIIPDYNSKSSCKRMERCVNRISHSSTYDLVRMSFCLNDIIEVNPFLTNESVSKLHSQILKWMEACVFEDKLKRIMKYMNANQKEEALRELLDSKQVWKSAQHPRWLAFEVEQCLEIRDIQYVIATFCMQNSRTVTQLNMGEGKTRVILPMLMTQISNSQSLIRLHVLSPLLSEAFYFFHHTLTASVLSTRICEIPFHRGILLSSKHATRMHEIMVRYQRKQNVILVAPEHRLSLELKQHEVGLMDSENATRIQQAIKNIEALPYYDILDESDELLSYKYQLIYAIGKCQMLPYGNIRWLGVQSLFNVLQNDADVRKILVSVANRNKRTETHAGAFECIRLLSGTQLDEQRYDFYVALARGLCNQPPLDFEWLNNKLLQPTFISFMVEKRHSLVQLNENLPNGGQDFSDRRKKALLVLRGLLAYGVLESCLFKRYRVNYGIDSRRKSRRVAVPFRGSDMPADRAEYAQPETLIVLTHLSYYHRGLTATELKEAVYSLLQLGPIAQSSIYNNWYKTGMSTMTNVQRSALDKVEKVDPSNDVLLSMMHTVYKYNMSTINFWLSTCVLPRETMQFPNRLSANAFNLADNRFGTITGFSGTKDSKLLLPSQIHQRIPDCPTIQGTDGKMLDLILQNDSMHCISLGSLAEKTLELIAILDVDVLIDAGASMAGLTNKDVANAIILMAQNSRFSKKRKGIVYYENHTKNWMVESWDKQCWPLGSSPIRECDAFVYFDEAHCRGADMKLKDAAVALLTIGPEMRKDKLMQAAGRMRKLDRGQRIHFAVPPELGPRITEGRKGNLSSASLLKWVLGNSMDFVANGMTEWASQGIQFCTTRHPATRIVEEQFNLEALYSGERNASTVARISNRMIETELSRIERKGLRVCKNESKILKTLQEHVNTYGNDFEVITSKQDEECEKEIEQELEIEREEEREFPTTNPRIPHLWDYSAVLNCRNVQDLPLNVYVEHLKDSFIKRYCDDKLKAIRWDSSDVFVTRNYISSVEETSFNGKLDFSEYLRPVDALLFFKSSRSFLLLSELEAGHILKTMWTSGSSSKWVTFLNFSEVAKTEDVSKILTESPMRIPKMEDDALGNLTSAQREKLETTLAALKLFAGITVFKSKESQAALRRLLPTKAGRLGVTNLVRVRGVAHMLACSDLQRICLQQD